MKFAKARTMIPSIEFTAKYFPYLAPSLDQNVQHDQDQNSYNEQSYRSSDVHQANFRSQREIVFDGGFLVEK